MIRRLRTILWQIGIMSNCPLCGKNVQEVCYLKFDTWQDYKCTNLACSFGKNNMSV